MSGERYSKNNHSAKIQPKFFKELSIYQASYLAYIELFFSNPETNSIIKIYLESNSNELLHNLHESYSSHFYEKLINIASTVDLTTFKMKILEKLSNFIYHYVITENEIPSINPNFAEKSCVIFTLTSGQSQHSLYKNLFHLPLKFKENYCLSGMVLLKNQHRIYLKIGKTKIKLYKIYKTEYFERWSEFFISMVEESLVPECWVYTRGRLIRGMKSNTWEKLEKFLYPEQSSCNTSYSSSKNQANSEKKINKSRNDTNRQNKLAIENLISNQPKKVVKGSNKNVEAQGKKNLKDSTKINKNQTRGVSSHELKNASKEPGKKPEIEEEKKDLNNGVSPIKILEKKWECMKCNKNNSLLTFNCACGFINENLRLSKNTQPEKLCIKCNQPSLRDYCRACLSDTNNQIPTTVPNGPKSPVMNQYSTVNPSTSNATQNNQYSTVDSNGYKTTGKRQSFNAAIRSNSSNNPRNNVQVKNAGFKEDLKSKKNPLLH